MRLHNQKGWVVARTKYNNTESDNEVVRRIAWNLTAILEERDISRRDLAKQTGDSVACVARVAAGTHATSIGTVARIAEALRIKVDKLLAPTICAGRRQA